jgi:hypothetical protein
MVLGLCQPQFKEAVLFEFQKPVNEIFNMQANNLVDFELDMT